MSATITLQNCVRELSYRETDGLQVSLLWTPANDAVSLLVTDTRTEESFELDVPSADALDAFEHPFAYAAGADLRTAA